MSNYLERQRQLDVALGKLMRSNIDLRMHAELTKAELYLLEDYFKAQEDKARTAIYGSSGIANKRERKKPLTCAWCGRRRNCPFVWESYNQKGECLMSKAKELEAELDHRRRKSHG